METIQVTAVEFRKNCGTFMDVLHIKIKFKVLVSFRGQLKWYVELQTKKPGKKVLIKLGSRKMYRLKKDSYTRNFWVRMPRQHIAPYEDMKAKSSIRVAGTLECTREVFFNQTWQTKIFYGLEAMDRFPPVLPKFNYLMWKIEEADCQPKGTQEEAKKGIRGTLEPQIK